VATGACKEEAGVTATDPGWRIHRGFCDVCDDGSNHMCGESGGNRTGESE